MADAPTAFPDERDAGREPLDSSDSPPAAPGADQSASEEDLPAPPEMPPAVDPSLRWRKEMLERELVSIKLLECLELMLKKYARRPLPWEDLVAEAQEVLGEVALRALDRLAQFNPDRAGALSWLMGIAINILRERQRMLSRDQSHFPSQSTFTEGQWAEIIDLLSPAPAPAHEGRLEEVWTAFAKLSAEYQEVLRLHYLQELPWSQVAERLGIGVAAARQRGCRALLALREQLGT